MRKALLPILFAPAFLSACANPGVPDASALGYTQVMYYALGACFFAAGIGIAIAVVAVVAHTIRADIEDARRGHHETDLETNADRLLVKNLKDLRRENDALREVLELMGFDAQECIKAACSPTEKFWYRVALGSIPASISPEYIAAHGFSSKAAASLQAVFSSLRVQPQPANAAARPARVLPISGSAK